MPLYPPSVERLHGIDPDEAMLSRARRTEEAAFPVELVAGSAEELPFDDQGFDAVSATLAFCTIPHPAEALLEARRVLKGGGELRLLEHVRIEHRPIGWLQEKATPLWKRVTGGCHLDRDTLALVHEAGFEVERVERHLDGLVLAVFARSSRAETTATRRTANRGTGS
ncbi:MAG: methyltransferase domain-containing protein [Actinomycetota bacterium]|nr:methyltransferase domain-containing protein [Actinomycetota bacterium]